MELAQKLAGKSPDEVFEVFAEWVDSRGLSLYPTQEEAVIELSSDANVILATPTGTGKSLVAIALHCLSLARGGKSYYTAPIKALVSEKFFDLVAIFGADNVGMVTGDSAVNPDAPIICCTAEILANQALRHGDDAQIDAVVMDEFHYYGDRDRGGAWQVPLLLLRSAQFLLMSATLGDVSEISKDLSDRTGRETVLVAGAERPVPLDFSYAKTPAHECVQELIDAGKTPIYIVHFSQAQALERAQALSSIRILDRAERDEIAKEIGDFSFNTGFGKTLSRLVRSGIGVHHAGMLPRYRRLVETLAQRGLLKVICGTDTLGVGINVPIRTVLITALSKYDGSRMRLLGAREFHQIAGRAGRAGFDTAGSVVVMAPEHEIENESALKKAGDDPAKRKKINRKKPAAGSVNWTELSFEKIVAASPEALVPRLEVSAGVLINVIGRGGDVLANMRELIFNSHVPKRRQYELARRALGIFRTLRAAGIVIADDEGIRLTVELPENFALNQALSPFALAALELFDAENSSSEAGTGHYAMDVVSVIEATLDDPRQILVQQEHKARGAAVAEMKLDGIEYEERMERLEEISYPKPLAELLEQSFRVFASSQPWVLDFELAPKSVVRDMYERGLNFREFISFYDLSRAEGAVLRYLSDAYRALSRTVPEAARDEELSDVILWLGELVRQIDSSLLDEWEALTSGVVPDAPIAPPKPQSVVRNRRAFTVLVRNEMFRRVALAALERDEELKLLDPDIDWSQILDEYYEEHDEIMTDGAARSPRLCVIDDAQEKDGKWLVEQIIADPSQHHDWRIRAEVDLAASAASGEATLRVLEVVRL